MTLRQNIILYMEDQRTKKTPDTNSVPGFLNKVFIALFLFHLACQARSCQSHKTYIQEKPDFD